MELDIKDSKLLLELDRNARQPISALAKKTGLSREVVQYRMKRLEETGVISRYTTIVDFHKIGFSQYKIYLKLQHISGEKYREILEHMIQNQDIKWVAECNGRWDLIVASITKTLVEFDGVKNDLFHRFAPFIAEKSITAMVSYYSKPRTYLLPKPPHEKPLRVESLQLPISINETDLRLLRLLGENSRQSVIELSRKLGVSPRIVAYRIQWFEKQGIIVRYRIGINLEKIGHAFFKSFITLENASEKRKEEFVQFCATHPNITHTVLTVGNWDIEPEFEVSSNEKFYALIHQIRTNYYDIVKTIETVMISREHKFQHL